MSDRHVIASDPEDLQFGVEPPAGVVAIRDTDPGFQGIPGGLEDMTPGPVMGALLSSIDMTEISGHDQVIVLRAHDRMASHHAAARFRAMAAVHTTMLELDGNPQRFEDAADSASAEVRAALRLTRRASDNEVALALALHRVSLPCFDETTSPAISNSALSVARWDVKARLETAINRLAPHLHIRRGSRSA